LDNRSGARGGLGRRRGHRRGPARGDRGGGALAYRALAPDGARAGRRRTARRRSETGPSRHARRGPGESGGITEKSRRRDMAKIAWQGLTLPILLLALPFAASAQDAAKVLGPTADALRVGEVESLTLTASGSGYARDSSGETPQPAGSAAATNAAAGTVDPGSPLFVPPPPPPERSYFRIVSHVQTLDLDAESLSIEQVRAATSAPDAERSAPSATTIDSSADWSLRHRYWLTPHAFVAGALAGNASVGTET